MRICVFVRSFDGSSIRRSITLFGRTPHRRHTIISQPSQFIYYLPSCKQIYNMWWNFNASLLCAMQWLSDLINLALFHEASRIVCWWWRNDTLDLVPMDAFDGCCCCFCYCNCIAFEPTDSILARFARITNGSSFSVVHTFSTRERSNNKFLRELAPRPSPSRRSSGTHMYTYIYK